MLESRSFPTVLDAGFSHTYPQEGGSIGPAKFSSNCPSASSGESPKLLHPEQTLEIPHIQWIHRYKNAERVLAGGGWGHGAHRVVRVPPTHAEEKEA